MSEKNKEGALELKPRSRDGVLSAEYLRKAIRCASLLPPPGGAEVKKIAESHLRLLTRTPTAEAEALMEIMGHVTGRPWLTNPDITYTDLVIILDRHGIPVQTKGEVSDG